MNKDNITKLLQASTYRRKNKADEPFFNPDRMIFVTHYGVFMDYYPPAIRERALKITRDEVNKYLKFSGTEPIYSGLLDKDDKFSPLSMPKPEDIKVTIEEGVLAIKGERKFEEEVDEGSYTRFERQYGSFERRFSLPSGIDQENVTADYKAGVLNLTIPKKEEAKPKSINIDVK